MKLFNALFRPFAFACLMAFLALSGCMTPPPPSPPGIIQVQREKNGFQLLRNGKVLCVLHPKYPKVERWKLVQQGTAFAIKSRGDPFGPAAVELFDVDTGERKEIVMTYGLAAGQPAWARGFEDYGDSVD
jgi:hypothetical protein